MMADIPARPPFIDAAAFMQRIGRAQSKLVQTGFDALIVNAGDSLRYFCGVPWQPTERLVALIIPASGMPSVICPHFETGSLSAVLKIKAGIRTWEEDESPENAALKGFPTKMRIALDREFTLGTVNRFRRSNPDNTYEQDPDIIDSLRACKDDAEIALIQYAMDITLQVHKDVHASLRPGMRASEVKSFVDTRHQELGADNGSYFCAVQFGQATAFPHGVPGDQILQDNDLVLVDTGCCIDGYHSDITRTYAFGKAVPEQQHIWNIEREAEQAAFEAAQPGSPCHATDDAARAVLQKYGLGPAYSLPGLPHRTGHGIGLSIHEFPYLVKGNRSPLQVGNCCSNEPMIVVPGQFGIRLEDHFHITEQGPRWFTQPMTSFTNPFS